MLKRILVYFLLAFLVLALVLGLIGVRSIGQGEKWMIFLQNFTKAFNGWKFKIPSIPKISSISKPSGQVYEVISGLIWIANLLVAIVNGLIMSINVLIMVINFVIAILQFVLTFFYCIKDFVNSFEVSHVGLFVIGD